MQPGAFEASLTLNNFADVTFRLFPETSPDAPLDIWYAGSPAASTLVELSYTALLPDLLYKFAIDGFVPASGRAIGSGGFSGSFGVAGASLLPESEVAPVSAVPLPGAIWLFGSGLAALLLASRRRR